MPQAVNAGVPSTQIEPGPAVTVISAVAAAQATPGSAISSQTGGTNTNPYFAVAPRGDGGSRILSLHARGAVATPTTVTVQLWASDDGGATWQPFQAQINLVVAGVATDFQVQNVPAGLIFQALVAALVLGGTATSVSVDAAVS